MQLERIYVNKLYSTVQIDSKFTNDKFESEKNFLIALECIVDLTTTYSPNPIVHKPAKSTIQNSEFCIVDFLNLK
jgi:hypothetical protein